MNMTRLDETFPEGPYSGRWESSHKYTSIQVYGTLYSELLVPYGTVIWGKTGRVKNFKVILKIFRKCFLEFFFHKKIHN
jgi:hypothetical protein